MSMLLRSIAWLGHGSMLFVAVAGIAKLASFHDFERSLASWTLLPDLARAPLAVLVPVAEIGVGAAWLLGVWRRVALAFGAAMILTFTLAAGAHLAAGIRPRCACLGAIAAAEHATEVGRMLIARNILLLVSMIGGGLAAIRASRRAPCTQRLSPPTSLKIPIRRVAPRGFTLIELIIVIAIIGLVVALSLPSFAALRRRTQELKSLANLRTHAMMHATYAGDEQDSFLYVCDPEATATVLRGGGVTATIGYWGLSQTWNIAMADEYYGGNATGDSLLVPWKPFLPPYTFYQYVWSFIARPEYWNPYTRLADRSQWRHTTLAEVTFPSAKGLIWERGQLPDADGVFYPLPIVRFALTDGSAIEERYQSLLRHYPGEEPVFSTIDGVRGRDVPGR